MARLAVELELEQVRMIVRDLNSALEPLGFARLHCGVIEADQNLAAPVLVEATLGQLVLKLMVPPALRDW